MILSNYKEFINQILKKIELLGINTAELNIDHIGYQASTDRDYNEKKNELKKLGKIQHDVQVGERRVAIFKLNNPLDYKGQIIKAVEIVSPKKNQNTESFWEHIEIIPNICLEDFMREYPKLKWETSVINRDIFPMIIIKLDDGTRVKFPRSAVLEEVKRINNL